MLWFLLWALLLIGAAAVLGLLGYRVFRQGMALLAELSDAAGLLSDAADRAARLAPPGPAPAAEPAVFADPAALRLERERRRRSSRRRRSRQRRPDRLPWDEPS